MLVVSSRVFGKSLSSPAYAEHLEGITLRYSPVKGAGFYEVEADTLTGRLDPAFLVYQWKGEKYPTVIYHHANLERPFNFHWYMKNTFRDIFVRSGQPVEANLIAVRAPYHRGFYIRYIKNIVYLKNFTAMLSVSVRLIEELVSHLKTRTNGRIIAAGISLGGLAVNLHRAHFNSADVYIPLCAGVSLADVFATSATRKVIRSVYGDERAVKEIVDFEEEFRKVKTKNVFPLLARHDQLFCFERQMESYRGYPVEVLDRGHWTGALSSKALRRHLLRFIH